MEHRFGFKDVAICVLLMVLIVSVWLAMKQYDRQWKDIKHLINGISDLTTKQAELNRQLGKISELIEGGIGLVPQTADDTAAKPQNLPDPFDRLKQAQQRKDYAVGDWHIEDFGVAPPTLIPLLSSDVYAGIVEARVLESLATMDPYTLDFKPLLASSWTENKEDLVIQFTLRRGITFSDGHERISQL